MALFDEAHKKQMKKNGEQLRKNLERDVAAGPKGDGLFDKMSFSFSRSLLNDLNNRKVVK